MPKTLFTSTMIALALVSSPANALYEGLQCVPFARALTGVTIFGDAHTWWGQAEGKYERGNKPKVGAVMAFIPHGNMRLGHVAAVRKIVDRRTLLISHANWSTIDGVRGHIEENVRVRVTANRRLWGIKQESGACGRAVLHNQERSTRWQGSDRGAILLAQGDW